MIVATGTGGEARVGFVYGTPWNQPRTTYIKSRGPWQIVARAHPLFFILGPGCPIFLATRQNSSVALYALLFKGAPHPVPLPPPRPVPPPASRFLTQAGRATKPPRKPFY